MRNIAVIGGQWGDEGKGKVIDLLSEHFAVVARFQGGPNAGHTVTIGTERHSVHQVPSGVFRPKVRNVVGNGTVIDPGRLLDELAELSARGIDTDGRLYLSDRAHVILPMWKRLDALTEGAADVSTRIGTTLRGVGPTYEAKAARWGVRLGDLADRDQLQRLLQRILDGPVGQRLRDHGKEVESAELVARDLHDCWKRLAPLITDTTLHLNAWIDEGLTVLFEGAQGTLLDVDHGSYPFVTSSSTSAGGVCAGLGVAPSVLGGVLGVFKAYATRVGSGPMPTELDDGPDGTGECLRRRGHEYGTTTGRPRRCGWFDGVAARYAQRINRFNAVCVMLLDVLDAFDEIRVCTGYRCNGRELQGPPGSLHEARAIEPTWETLPGWKIDLTGIDHWEDLPREARGYLDRLGELIGTEVALAGVGPERSQSLVRPGSWLERQLGCG